MAYYCFLCNENHDDSIPKDREHFIPRSINGPEHQWLPVCKASNTRSNTIFDNNARDLFFWKRFLETRSLKRYGEALLADGSLKLYRLDRKSVV